MARRTALPFEQQLAFNSALFMVGLDAGQLANVFTGLLGFDSRRAGMVPMIVAQLGVSSQPANGGRVVVLINPDNGYDVALDVF